MFTFIIFFSSVGLLFVSIFYIINIALFKVKGETMFLRPKKGSPEYDRLSKLSSGLRIVYGVMMILTLMLIIFLSAYTIASGKKEDSISTMIIGSALTLALVVILCIISLNMGERKKGNAIKKNNWIN